MTTDEREKAQASFMQSGRKVVMLATNAFGLGIDKPDIRYIIHYQMPGSPESYVQEAGRAGRDGKPARCVLLFQPDDIAIQEHFLKEAHPTKTQARMVAEGLYAWSDEGKEVSVRDLALSMALPERRVRVILSVLEAMGVAEEVKAARWKGVEPKPTREAIDKAASVFEARRISDRRRLASLLAYMNTQRCRVQMLRAYFGEPEGDKCGLCDSCAGLDSEMFDPGSDDARHGLHAATDFHARPRRRRRRGGEEQPQQQPQPQQMRHPQRPQPRPFQKIEAPPPPPTFATAIPTDVPPPLAPMLLSPPSESESQFDPTVWDVLDERAGTPMSGEPVMDDLAGWIAARASSVAADQSTDGGLNGVNKTADRAVTAVVSDPSAGLATDLVPIARCLAIPPMLATFLPAWEAVRDANIRPYAAWRASESVSLPVIPRPSSAPPPGTGRPPHPGHSGGGGAKGPSGGPGHSGGRRRRRGGTQFRDHRDDRGERGDRDRNRDRDRGPRLPGFYNPGGD